MIPILNPKQMYELDDYLISNVGIASLLLMENAASQSAYIINGLVKEMSSILILCGTGNNGGDGLSLVRQLNNNHKVDFIIVGDKEKFSIETQTNFDILHNMNLIEINAEETLYNRYDCIVDSMLGIGSKIPLRNNLSKIIEKTKQIKAIKVSIDIPTGLDSLTGIADENAFIADYTLTMYAEKPGLLLNDGKDFSGKIITLNLGITSDIIDRFSTTRKFNETKKLQRQNNTSKFDYGKCFIVAGSIDMSGAGALAANACITAGSGIVYLCTTRVNSNLFPEVISFEVDSYSSDIFNKEPIKGIIDKCDSIVIGPGLGKSDVIGQMVEYVIANYKEKIIIIDADAISYLNEDKVYNQNIIITPHIGEFSNLVKVSRLHLKSILVDKVKETAKKMNLNIVLKGATTIISDGEETIFVSDGVPEMATAGSGDVLSGILGAQLNQNICNSKLENIANAVLTHINAAKSALDKNNSIIASDIISGLKCIK